MNKDILMVIETVANEKTVSKDIIVDDVKDAVGGVTDGVKGAVDGIKNEIKK